MTDGLEIAAQVLGLATLVLAMLGVLLIGLVAGLPHSWAWAVAAVFIAALDFTGRHVAERLEREGR